MTTAGRIGAEASAPARAARTRARRWLRRLPLLLVPLAGILLWQAVVWAASPREWLLPSPGTVLDVLWTERDRLWFHAQATIRETVVGFLVALVIGLALAALIAASRVADRAVYPWVVASQAIPILAVAPVMAIWLDYGTTQVVVAALMCVFPIVVTGVDGLRAADPRLVRTARALGASRAWTWWHVTLPAAMPPLLTGLRMAVVFAVSGAVVAEYVGADRGLGYLTEIATAQFETAVAFAAIALLALLGVLLFLAVALAERLLLPHRHRPTRPRWRPTA